MTWTSLRWAARGVVCTIWTRSSTWFQWLVRGWRSQDAVPEPQTNNKRLIHRENIVLSPMSARLKMFASPQTFCSASECDVIPNVHFNRRYCFGNRRWKQNWAGGEQRPSYGHLTEEIASSLVTGICRMGHRSGQEKWQRIFVAEMKSTCFSLHHLITSYHLIQSSLNLVKWLVIFDKLVDILVLAHSLIGGRSENDFMSSVERAVAWPLSEAV